MTKREMRQSPDNQSDAREMLDKMLLHLPGVHRGKGFGHDAYTINGKIFAIVDDGFMIIKLPAPRIGELIAEHEGVMKPFEPKMGVVWREWVTITPEAGQYTLYHHLLDEAIQFVAGTIR